MYFLEGIPDIYQGEELGMANTDFASIDEFNDVEVLNYWQEHVRQKGEDPDKVLKLLNLRSRDTSRSPMPWNDSMYAGFSTVRPWPKVGSQYRHVNVEAEEKDPDSVLSFYRQLIEIRHGKEAVLHGELKWIDLNSEKHMSYIRETENELILSLNNFTEGEVTVSVTEETDVLHGKILLTNTGRKKLEGSRITLQPWECLTYIVRKADASK